MASRVGARHRVRTRRGPGGSAWRLGVGVVALASVGWLSTGCSSRAKVVSTTTTAVSASTAELDRCEASARGRATVFQADIDDCEAAFAQQYTRLDCPDGEGGIVVKVGSSYYALLAGSYATRLGPSPPSPTDPALCT